MSINHFVGDYLSISFIEKEDDAPMFRIAKEKNPDQFIDLEGPEWNELFTVVTMIRSAREMHNTMDSPQIAFIPYEAPPDEDGQSSEVG